MVASEQFINFFDHIVTVVLRIGFCWCCLYDIVCEGLFNFVVVSCLGHSPDNTVKQQTASLFDCNTLVIMLLIFHITIIVSNCVCIVEVDILLLRMMYFLFHFLHQYCCGCLLLPGNKHSELKLLTYVQNGLNLCLSIFFLKSYLR